MYLPEQPLDGSNLVLEGDRLGLLRYAQALRSAPSRLDPAFAVAAMRHGVRQNWSDRERFFGGYLGRLYVCPREKKGGLSGSEGHFFGPMGPHNSDTGSERRGSSVATSSREHFICHVGERTVGATLPRTRENIIKKKRGRDCDV